MNGMMLKSAPETKDIKFIDKKGADIESQEGGELFEKIVASLIEEDKDSKNRGFLLEKLLNLGKDFDKKGKTYSDFSKDDILDAIKSDIDTKSNKSDNLLDDILDNNNEEVLLEDLFKLALNIKNDQMPTDNEIKSKPLQLALNNKDVIKELKSAKNIKELLNIAEKNGIKVKNFEFFKEEAILNSEDKKLVQKVTSQDIFKMIEPKKNFKDIENKKADHSILTKLISKEKHTQHNELKHTTPTNPNTNQTITKEITNLNEEQPIKANHKKKVLTTKKDSSPQKMDNTALENSIELDKDAPQKENTNKKEDISILSTKEPKHAQNQRQHIKSPQNTLAEILKKDSSTEETTKSDESMQSKDKSIEDIKDNSSQKSTNDTEIKTHHTTKTKEPQDVKKSLNTFAMEFKEKVESYKAPLMKVKMQLSPQNLGDVDVTLVNRGNTLHVNITSNTNSMALFMQNQAEFKNSLVNMGFTDLQMNFSQNGNSQNQQQKQDEKNSNNFENLTNEEESDSVDIIIPNYV